MDIQTWAKLGAGQRLQEIDAERASILKVFPDLGGTDPIGAKRPKTEAAPKRKARYKMSAAQKKAVSARMKKYWAARRKSDR